ncbi:MAG: ferritin [Bacteroidota bacterium]
MISKKIEEALNNQIKLEAYASFLYLSMASWCDLEGMEGCAQFMHRQSSEERDHMLRIFNYISEVDGHAIVPEVAQPPKKFESIQELFKQVYAHEQKVTRSINGIVDLCYKEDDYSTLNFLQWYIEEQREEEDLMRTILDRIKLIGEGPQSLYYVDKEMDKINQAEAAAEAAEA